VVQVVEGQVVRVVEGLAAVLEVAEAAAAVAASGVVDRAAWEWAVSEARGNGTT
jgi:hypothetical protein